MLEFYISNLLVLLLTLFISMMNFIPWAGLI